MRASASIPPYREAKEPISSSTVYILYIHTYIQIHFLVQMGTKYLTYVEYITYIHTFTHIHTTVCLYFRTKSEVKLEKNP